MNRDKSKHLIPGGHVGTCNAATVSTDYGELLDVLMFT